MSHVSGGQALSTGFGPKRKDSKWLSWTEAWYAMAQDRAHSWRRYPTVFIWGRGARPSACALAELTEQGHRVLGLGIIGAALTRCFVPRALTASVGRPYNAFPCSGSCAFRVAVWCLLALGVRRS
jgi:hypothetical protein